MSLQTLTASGKTITIGDRVIPLKPLTIGRLLGVLAEWGDMRIHRLRSQMINRQADPQTIAAICAEQELLGKSIGAVDVLGDDLPGLLMVLVASSSGELTYPEAESLPLRRVVELGRWAIGADTPDGASGASGGTSGTSGGGGEGKNSPASTVAS